MNEFHRTVALRIAVASVLLACVASPAAWFVAREKSEQAIVALAIEESRRLIDYFHATDAQDDDTGNRASRAAQTLSGGLFDIAEIYDSAGTKIAEAMTESGKAIESALPRHVAPRYSEPSYSRYTLASGDWSLRVFVPLRSKGATGLDAPSGYFEGVRITPPWQRQQMVNDALLVALMVGLASLLCGAAMFPVVLRLSAEVTQKSQALVQSQRDLIEGLQQSEIALEGKVAERTAELQTAQRRTQELLHNMLPSEIAQELSLHGFARPVRHESVTILFTDFSDFTLAASTMPAHRVVDELNEIFAGFDAITDACGVEKIKTIGDSYMAAAGVPSACPDHAQRCVNAALLMVEQLATRNLTASFKWSLRVGIHTGPVVAGVVGTRKFAFDIWGDTVNIASRMESSGEVGRVNISAYTYDLVRDQYACEYRGKVHAKGKGAIDMYFVMGAIPPEHPDCEAAAVGVILQK